MRLTIRETITLLIAICIITFSGVVSSHAATSILYFNNLASIAESWVADNNQAEVDTSLEIDNEPTYSSFETELIVNEIQTTNSETIMKATEHTQLFLTAAEYDPLVPESTEYFLDHIFRFERNGKDWKLISDDLINVPTSVTPGPDTQIIPKPITTTQLIVDYQPITLKESFDPEGAILITLNRTSIKNYAYNYWSSYNPSYRSYSSDCTNFVSQAVKAGGWTYVDGSRTSNYAWYYGLFTFTTSYTWAGAENWYWFSRNRPRAYTASYFSQMEIGDVLQMDFTRDNVIDHSMIVTAKSSSGTIYLTYHTNNTRDKSITTLLSQYPNAAYYGARLYNSFN